MGGMWKDKIHSMSMRTIDNVFAVESGFVLNFSNNAGVEVKAKWLRDLIVGPKRSYSRCPKSFGRGKSVECIE